MKIVDIYNRNKILGVGEIGELCIKGPQVMKGYLNRPEATARDIIDGWLYTGDIAKVDEDGFTVIVDRIKDMIKYKGHSVYPAEVEDLLYEHPAVLDAAVIGIPDEETGENIKAFITLKDEYIGKVTEQELMDWAKENIAKYKYPRYIEFINEMPKGTAGKVLRRELRK